MSKPGEVQQQLPRPQSQNERAIVSANIHVQEGGECHWDRVTFRNLKDVNAACHANSDLLKVCFIQVEFSSNCSELLFVTCTRDFASQICDHGLDCVPEIHCRDPADVGWVVTGKRCRAPLPKTPITTSPPPTQPPVAVAAAAGR